MKAHDRTAKNRHQDHGDPQQQSWRTSSKLRTDTIAAMEVPSAVSTGI
ncbi:hypothetical protein [Paenibacillus lactis]